MLNKRSTTIVAIKEPSFGSLVLIKKMLIPCAKDDYEKHIDKVKGKTSEPKINEKFQLKTKITLDFCFFKRRLIFKLFEFAVVSTRISHLFELQWDI